MTVVVGRVRLLFEGQQVHLFLEGLLALLLQVEVGSDVIVQSKLLRYLLVLFEGKLLPQVHYLQGEVLCSHINLLFINGPRLYVKLVERNLLLLQRFLIFWVLLQDLI
mmetsp:Transcript_12619/g.12434  ORF Transcript_12619/g.12434 Transcript_12619/m.12434 type:complete len:108 (-) Transcript_12619:794-1117(-)